MKHRHWLVCSFPAVGEKRRREQADVGAVGLVHRGWPCLEPRKAAESRSVLTRPFPGRRLSFSLCSRQSPCQQETRIQLGVVFEEIIVFSQSFSRFCDLQACVRCRRGASVPRNVIWECLHQQKGGIEAAHPHELAWGGHSSCAATHLPESAFGPALALPVGSVFYALFTRLSPVSVSFGDSRKW